MILTDDELFQLTGFSRPSKQAEWLKANGFNYRLGADGHPKVLRAHVCKMMGADVQEKRQFVQPDFSRVVA